MSIVNLNGKLVDTANPELEEKKMRKLLPFRIWCRCGEKTVFKDVKSDSYESAVKVAKSMVNNPGISVDEAWVDDIHRKRVR